MNPIRKLRAATAIFRARYGALRGTLLWLSLLAEKFKAPGALLRVRLPDVAHPVYLRAHTSDIDVLCQVFLQERIDQLCPSGARVIVDAGANIGLASVLFANRFPTARIVALEVDTANTALLKKNAAPYPLIEIVESGLWRRRCFLEILNPQDPSWAFRVGEAAGAHAGAIPALGVADLLQRIPEGFIDILKIDIEGAERDVFDAGTEGWLPQVGLILVELHDRFRPGCSDSVKKAVAPFAVGWASRGEYEAITLRAA